jgi:hypothetical protein
MRLKLSVAALLLVASAGTALADDMCGDLPIGPALPSPADIQRKTPAEAAEAQRGAFLDIKKWQESLKSYRECLNATVSTNKRDLGEMQRSDKPDQKKITQLQDSQTELGHMWDKSVDEEERVVNEFHAVQVAYCLRKDVDRASCPKT